MWWRQRMVHRTTCRKADSLSPISSHRKCCRDQVQNSCLQLVGIQKTQSLNHSLNQGFNQSLNINVRNVIATSESKNVARCVRLYHTNGAPCRSYQPFLCRGGNGDSWLLQELAFVDAFSTFINSSELWAFSRWASASLVVVSPMTQV
jgi:hypothetical protein